VASLDGCGSLEWTDEMYMPDEFLEEPRGLLRIHASYVFDKPLSPATMLELAIATPPKNWSRQMHEEYAPEKGRSWVMHVFGRMYVGG
jgi:hypothetical protein